MPQFQNHLLPYNRNEIVLNSSIRRGTEHSDWYAANETIKNLW